MNYLEIVQAKGEHIKDVPMLLWNIMWGYDIWNCSLDITGSLVTQFTNAILIFCFVII